MTTPVRLTPGGRRRVFRAYFAPDGAESASERGSTKSTAYFYANAYSLNMSPNFRVATANPCDSL